MSASINKSAVKLIGASNVSTLVALCVDIDSSGCCGLFLGERQTAAHSCRLHVRVDVAAGVSRVVAHVLLLGGGNRGVLQMLSA